MTFRLNDDIVGRMLKDYSYKGSEHKESIFKKDVVHASVQIIICMRVRVEV